MTELLKWDDVLEDKVVVDTNLLLDDSKILFKLTKKFNHIVIPITVLKELDKLKFKPETAFSARQAIRALLEFRSKFSEKIIFDIDKSELDNDESNDVRIIKSAQRHNATLATKDISMDLIAEAQDIKTKLYDVVLNNIFNPYIYIEQDKLFDVLDTGVFGYGRILEKEEYYELFDALNKLNNVKTSNEAWFFLIINTPTSEPVVYAHNPFKKAFIRIDNSPTYRTMKVDKKEIKAKDIYQNCAIYALKEAPNVLITGKWGTGKTLLATSQALNDEDKKIFISRAPIGLNSKYDIGFLPGSKDEKMQDWLAGFMSALYFLYANTKGQSIEGRSFDYIKDVVFKSRFEPVSMNSIQGLSLLDGDTLIVDEVQLITVDYMSMILSRPSKSGRLILLGDLGQTYDVVKPSESGLLKLLRVLPHKSLAYVDLKTAYRSDILELAELLQDKTIGD